MSDIAHPDLIATRDYPYPYAFETFNPVQSAVFRKKDSPHNMIVAASTSAGKTIAAELLMDTVLRRGKRVIYLSPLKSLTEEKYADWQIRYAGRRIAIMTGDYELTAQTAEQLKQSHIIVMTSEMMDSRTRKFQAERNDWMHEVGLVVVDESHILSTARGDAVETGIMRFTALCPEAGIVLLSATMSNGVELGQWLTALNGKPTDLVQSAWRPVALQMHYLEYLDVLDGSGKSDYWATESMKMQMALDLILSKPEEKFLVFVHSKTIGRRLRQQVAKLGISSAFHNADLRLEKRRKHEAAFKDRENGIRVLISTSTTAWGINLPARNVVILGVHRGLQRVDELDIIQMAGRAGRYGIDTEGHVHLIIPAGEKDDWNDIFNHPRPVTSVLNNREKLAFHVLAEIENQVITDEADLLRWYRRSLTFRQGAGSFTEVEARTVLADLKQMKMIADGASGYRVTPLGRVSAMMYYHPYDVSAWHRNLSWIEDNRLVSNPAALAWAIADVPSNRCDYLPRDLQHLVQPWHDTLRFLDKKPAPATVPAIEAVYNCLTGLQGEGPVGSKMRSFKSDAARLLNAFRMIDRTCAHWQLDAYWDLLERRLCRPGPAAAAAQAVAESVAAERQKSFAEAISKLEANACRVIKAGEDIPARKCNQCGKPSVIAGENRDSGVRMTVCFHCSATTRYIPPEKEAALRQSAVEHLRCLGYRISAAEGGDRSGYGTCPVCGAGAVVTGRKEVELRRGTSYDIYIMRYCYRCCWQESDCDFYNDDFSDMEPPSGYEDEQQRLRDVYGEGGFETEDGYFIPESWDPS